MVNDKFMQQHARKMAPLREDEFYPHAYFKGQPFVRIPILIAKHNHLSLGAKMLYGVLLGLAPSGTAWPTKGVLKDRIGGASVRTIYRWQTELEKAGLIRVKQKGRGLSNNYYFLKSHIIENAPMSAATPTVPTAIEAGRGENLPNNSNESVSLPPKRIDFGSDTEYFHAHYEWELQNLEPQYLLEVYGPELLRQLHGVEALSMENGDVVLSHAQAASSLST